MIFTNKTRLCHIIHKKKDAFVGTLIKYLNPILQTDILKISHIKGN